MEVGREWKYGRWKIMEVWKVEGNGSMEGGRYNGSMVG